MLPWWVVISAVVQIGSTILRSECSDTLSVVCGAGGRGEGQRGGQRTDETTTLDSMKSLLSPRTREQQ